MHERQNINGPALRAEYIRLGLLVPSTRAETLTAELRGEYVTLALDDAGKREARRAIAGGDMPRRRERR